MQKQNGKQQFDLWYQEYHEQIFRFCLSKTSSREVALDLTQEAFIRLWDSLRAGSHIENPRALLFTIVRNLIVDHYRKKKTDSLDTILDAGTEFGEKARAETDIAYQEALRAIATLPEAYREAIYLRYVEELPPRDIAEITGESVNVISVRITRGMKELRETLEQTNP